MVSSRRSPTGWQPCRVNGNLNLSRAIGDLKYKGNENLAPAEQIITAQPDIVKVAAIFSNHCPTPPCSLYRPHLPACLYDIEEVS